VPYAKIREFSTPESAIASIAKRTLTAKGFAMSARKLILTAALAFLVSGTGTGRTADGTPVSAKPVYVIQAGGVCTTCEAAPVSTTCASCGNDRALMAHLRHVPRAASLCPDSCFGYYPTMWRKWEDVCPSWSFGYVDLSHMHSPGFPPASDMPPRKSGSIPNPRPIQGTRIN